MTFAAARRLCQPQLVAALATAAEAAPPRQLVHLAAFSSSAASTQSGRVLGACVFERLPLVAPPDADWELEYFTWQAELTEKYYKQLPKELIDPKKLVEETTTEGGSRWEPAPLETEADRAGDRRSLRRRLDQRIFLLVRPAGKADGPYMLPHSEHKEGETIRQTAERVLGETVTVEEVQPYFVGNSPAGHVETEAGTMFFNRCQLIQGTPSLRPGSGYSDYAWVAKDELGEYIKHRPTLDLLRKML